MSTDNTVQTATRTIKASEFKAKCLRLMDEVAESGQEIVITKNGHPVSKLTPIRERPKAPFGLYRGKVRVSGDIVSPMPAGWFEKPNADEGLF